MCEVGVLPRDIPPVSLWCDTYTSLGDMKDVDPEVIQGVFNFIDTNTQVPEQVEVPDDVKKDFDMSSTPTMDTDGKDEFGTLRALNKVSFGI